MTEARNNVATPTPLSASIRTWPAVFGCGTGPFGPRANDHDDRCSAHTSRDPLKGSRICSPLRPRHAAVLPVSVAHAPRAGEGDRHRRPQGRTRGSHTPRPAKRPWLSPFLREHRTSVAGDPPAPEPVLDKEATRQPMDPADELLTPAKVAQLFGVDPKTGHPMGGLRTSRIHPHPRRPSQIPSIGDHRAAHRGRPPRTLINRHAVQFPDEPVGRPILSRKAPTQ